MNKELNAKFAALHNGIHTLAHLRVPSNCLYELSNLLESIKKDVEKLETSTQTSEDICG